MMFVFFDRMNKLPSTFQGDFVDQILPQLLSFDNQPIVVILQLIQEHKFQGKNYLVISIYLEKVLYLNHIVFGKFIFRAQYLKCIEALVYD